MDNPHTPREGKQIPTAQATKEQLRVFLTELGGKHTNFDDEQRLREKIYGKGWEEKFITVFEDDPRAQAEVDEPDEGKPARVPTGPVKDVKEPMVEIRISHQQGEAGKRPFFAGVNGVGILLPRNIPILVKHRYYHALRNMIEAQYTMEEATQSIERSDVPALPFEVLRMPPDAELKAWSDYKAALQAQEVAERRSNIKAA